MSSFIEAVDVLRAAVAAASAADDPEFLEALAAAGCADAEVGARRSGDLSFVRLEAPEPASLAELEGRFGRANRLPSRASGGEVRRTVQFTATIPAEGTTGATVLAELDDADRVLRVTLRRDAL